MTATETGLAADTSRQKGDRWLFFLIVTVGLNLASSLLFPLFVTDAFTSQAFSISVIPVFWGFSLLFFYRSNRERFVAWLAVTGSLYWVIPTIGMPIQFWGR
jgi:hypothetical protein